MKSLFDKYWNNFEEVTSRFAGLPKLIDLFEKKNFSYSFYASGTNHMPGSSPKLIFNRKYGNCDAYSTFTEHSLKKGNVSAWIEWIDKIDGHYTTMFKKNSSIYILDNAYYKIGGIQGPFKSVSEAKKAF